MENLWTKGRPSLHLERREGRGPPLLLLHGLAGNTRWWDPVAPRIEGAFKIWAMDFEGHGDSDWREDGEYGPEGFIKNIEEARRFVGADKIAIGAHSMGARVALDYAAAHPQNISAMVLVDFLAEAYETKAFRFEALKRRPQPVFSDDAAMRKRFRLEPPGTLLGAGQLEALAGCSLKRLGNGFTWKFHWKAFACRCDAVWGVLPEVVCPTIVVRGGRSTVMEIGDFQRVLAGLKDAVGVEIPEAHHHVPLDAPEALAQVFLNRLRPLLPSA